MSRPSAFPNGFRLAIACLSLPALMLLAGCGESSKGGGTPGSVTLTSSQSGAGAPAKTGKELLQRLSAAYRQAVTYSDRGVARIEYKLNGKETKHEFPFSVSFAQPNRLWLKAYEGQVVCDGKKISALHESVRGYVRTAAAPEKLTAGKIYGDQFLWSQLNERQVGGPLQLEFLLNDRIVPDLCAPQNPSAQNGAAGGESSEPELLDPADLGGQMCQRVQLTLPQGKMVFWIAQATGVLRRVDYPTEEFRRTLEQDGAVSDVVVMADFVEAQLNEPLADGAFSYEPPAGAKEIKQFVGPAPADVMGKKAAAFEFTSLADGQKITTASLEGKVVVLDFWATWCEYCQKKMPDIAKAYEKYKGNDKVRFLVVSIDQPEVTNDQVKAKLAGLKIDLPAARDDKFQAFSNFKVPGIPSRILLAADGTIQAGAVGLTAQGVDPVAELSGKIDALLSGKNLYADMVAEFEKAMSVPPPEPTDTAEGPQQPEIKTAPKSEPQSIKLTPRWTCTDAVQPGNVLVIPAADGSAKLFVIEGFHAVVELNAADGKLVTKHDLKLPEQTAVAFLRTAVDGLGKRFFAVSAVGQQQVFTFDEAWQPIGHYPPKGAQAAVGDVQLADLDGDGKLELCVGFLQQVGVHAASLEGQKRWACEKLSNVISLAVTAPDGEKRRKIHCVHEPGKITPIDHAGAPGKEIAVGQRAVRWLLSAKLEGDADVFAGFAYVSPEGSGAQGANAQVTDAVIGIDLAGKDLWTYPLPTGQQPWLEQLATGRAIGAQRHWIAAAADGSLHFVAADGKPLDRFNVGTTITGFAAIDIAGKPHLILATGDKLQAWQIEAK